MDDNLLWKILNDCKAHRDSISQIVPYHNNEPLTDTRIFDVLRFIRDAIQVPAELSTNISLLATDARAEELVSAIAGGTIRVSFFGANPESYEARMGGLKWEKSRANLYRLLDAKQKLGSTLRIELVMIAYAGLTNEEVAAVRAEWEPLGAEVVVFGLLDRAGNTRTKNLLPIIRRTARIVGCDLNRPFERLNVNVSGNAVLCSQDWRSEVVLGNLNTSEISEVWNSERYQMVRQAIRGQLIAKSDFICRSCKIAIFE